MGPVRLLSQDRFERPVRPWPGYCDRRNRSITASPTSNLSRLSLLSDQYRSRKKSPNMTAIRMRPTGFSHGFRNILKLLSKSIVFGRTKKPPAYVPTCEHTPTACEYNVCASLICTTHHCTAHHIRARNVFLLFNVFIYSFNSATRSKSWSNFRQSIVF